MNYDNEPQWVYIMTNANHPDFLKIGATKHDPRLRAEQLSASSGVALPFVVAYHRQVHDCHKIERQIHSVLEKHRVNRSREFFHLRLADAIVVMDQLADGSVPFEDYSTPFAELFLSFPPQPEGSQFENILHWGEQAACRALEKVRPFQRKPGHLTFG